LEIGIHYYYNYIIRQQYEEAVFDDSTTTMFEKSQENVIHMHKIPICLNPLRS
jgi:hypothetical protein